MISAARAARVLACIGAALFVSGAEAQDYPNRPITIVTPYAGGASTDQVARILLPKLQASLGQPVIVENKGGGSGNIGTAHVAKAAPDGYTILLTTNAIMAINPNIFKSLPFDPEKDFVPLTTAVRAILAVAANPSIPVNSLAELITYAKAQAKPLHYGTAGIGTPHHMAGVLLNQRAGINLVHVPYKGSGPALNDLLGGHIELGITTLVTILPQAESGKVKILAIGEKARFDQAPKIPAVSETLPGFEATSWLAFFAPSGTPQPIVDRLSKALIDALNAPDVRQKLLDGGLPVVADKPEELAKVLKSDLALWGKLAREMNVQAE